MAEPPVEPCTSTTQSGPSRRELVIVANRLPVCRDESTVGGWKTSPGGLVAALAPAIRAGDATWVGWSGVPGSERPPAHHEHVGLVPIDLDCDEIGAFYEGFSNSSIWPLYHDAVFIPQFHRSWWEAYVGINYKFAQAAAAAAKPGAMIWVHDYQLQLVPQMIREIRDDLRVGFYLHIPFPSQELFLHMPWRTQIVRGILGADVVGFQTVVGAQNFRQVAQRLIGCEIEGDTLRVGDRSIIVDTLPVGIDADAIARESAEPRCFKRAQAIREELGNPRTVVLGVDRLDYTKGIEVRLRAYQELLEDGRVDPSKTVMVQIAEPSRNDVPGYAEIRTEVEHLVGAINGDHGSLSSPAVQYLHQSQSFEELVALYRAADVMVVTPFRDGMNLVAKEYVAAKIGFDGTLVLSEFAGAAHELTSAIIVNPFDIDGLKVAIERAINQAHIRSDSSMRTLGALVHEHDAQYWATSFLRLLEAAD